jgi:hypothetical protein
MNNVYMTRKVLLRSASWRREIKDMVLRQCGDAAQSPIEGIECHVDARRMSRWQGLCQKRWSQIWLVGNKVSLIETFRWLHGDQEVLVEIISKKCGLLVFIYMLCHFKCRPKTKRQREKGIVIRKRT